MTTREHVMTVEAAGRLWAVGILEDLPCQLVARELGPGRQLVPSVLGVWSVPQQQILVHPLVAWWSPDQRDGALLAALSAAIAHAVAATDGCAALRAPAGGPTLIVGPR